MTKYFAAMFFSLVPAILIAGFLLPFVGLILAWIIGAGVASLGFDICLKGRNE